MAMTDSALDPAAVSYIRGLLKPPLQKDGRWAALAAAAFAALTAMAFAISMIMAPPTTTRHLPAESESITLSMTPALR
ncbi:MAG: hypothetical protein BGN86_13295 [Caulobacterales bacterium 68-7]|nr:hypothetical protein [Caulobacterales bacterium]OJU08318.1 MAG: hypothetical protein BGN86_13295 [Caulobacterales bacterium 68-7]